MLEILYVQTLRLNVDLCRTSRVGLVDALTRRGCRVTLVAGYEGVRPAVGPHVVLVPSIPLPLVRQFSYSVLVQLRVLALLLTHRFDVVIVDPYTVTCTFPFDVLAKLGVIKRPKVVLDVRSGIFHTRPGRWAERARKLLIRIAFTYARRMFPAFTTITPMMRDMLVSEFDLPADRIGIWQSAVSLQESSGPRAAVAPDGGFVVMYHGSFGTNRGLTETVRAMALVKETHSDVVLFLLGEGTEESKLRELARGATNVIFHSTVPPDAVASFVSACHVGVLPFLPTNVMRASSPLKLMEYLAAGKPVIVSRIEAFTNVMGDTPAAIYLREQTPEAIADAIRHAADSRHRLAEWGARGRQIVEAGHTWDAQAERLHRFLEAVA